MGHGEFIKKIRKEKYLTQKELAEGILSKNFLSKFERGESKITSEIFMNLLERLNVSLDEFEQLVTSKHSQKEFLQKLRQLLSQREYMKFLSQFLQNIFQPSQYQNTFLKV